MKLLVVDDEPDLELLIRQKFRKRIQQQEMQFVFAQNGTEALKVIDQDPGIEIVLTDINMPEMDGLTLLGRLHENNARPLLKSIVVSAYGDMENIRTAMNRGAFDFVTKPIDFGDLELTINKTWQQIRTLRDALLAHEKLLSIQQELDIARRIQLAILPRKFPPFPDRKDIDIYASMTAAKEVGGDFYDFFFIDEDHLAFVIGDVSGKGVPAAIFMAMSRTLIKATALKKVSASECITYTNRLLSAESESAMFVTTFFGILNTKTGAMEYANGGHNPPYILRKGGNVVEVEPTGGLVVGIMPQFSYEQKTIQMNPGDCIYLYTDGVTEAMDASGEMYSDARLAAFLTTLTNASTTELIKNIAADVEKFAGDAPQSDDITSLAVRFVGS